MIKYGMVKRGMIIEEMNEGGYTTLKVMSTEGKVYWISTLDFVVEADRNKLNLGVMVEFAFVNTGTYAAVLLKE